MKMLKLSIFSVFVSLVAISCQSQPGGTDAETGAAQEVENVSASANEYALNISSSEFSWYGFKPTGRHEGTIGIKDGMLAVENSELVGGTITMDMTDINVNDLEGEDKQKLTGHLSSPDFFAVEQYPTAEFQITDVQPYGGAIANEGENNMELVVNDEPVDEYAIDAPTHTITGNLTMRDTTLSITFPAKVNITDDKIEAQAKFNIDRTQWNVSYGDETDPVAKAQDKFIYNTVNVGFDVVADKSGATS